MPPLRPRHAWWLPAAVLATACSHTALAATPDKPSFLVLLLDDVGWGDFLGRGHAITTNIDALAADAGSLNFNDFHSGGTVCSPTRASVLTGRNPSRDCVNGVYGCSDMTECVPGFEFAPGGTWTAPMAVKAADASYTSFFAGKWHLGSFYNDSAKYGGVWSSPISHGFEHFNATVEVAPTATTNCDCKKEWQAACQFGHDKKATHCNGHTGPGGNNCCFNYWWESGASVHGVTNLTNPTPPDDTVYLTQALDKFLDDHEGQPFFAQVSFHNCHIPYIGLSDFRAKCASGELCRNATTTNFTDAQLDFYACLLAADAAVGRVLESLSGRGLRQDTMVVLTADNGPETLGTSVCKDGRCTAETFKSYPGSAGPLRGRKRDTWEGGHRVLGVLSWPRRIHHNRQVNDAAVTSDILTTIADVLNVRRPASQASWGWDGTSLVPVIDGGGLPPRGIGWIFGDAHPTSAGSHAFRYGPWKLVRNSNYCEKDTCNRDLLYNLDDDLGENHDLSASEPEVLAAITANYTAWLDSVNTSRVKEQGCEALAPTAAAAA